MITSAARELAITIAGMITGYEDNPDTNADDILPLITAALKKCRNEALEEAAFIAGGRYHNAKATQKAHERHVKTPFRLEDYGLDRGEVSFSEMVMTRIDALKEPE